MTEAQIAAVAGEHFIAHKLAMLGFVPALLRQRIPGIDILVSSADGKKTVAVRVRSAFNAVRELPDSGEASSFRLRFPLGQRAIATTDEMTFFCFVDLRKRDAISIPDVYVIPSPVLKNEYAGVITRKYSHLYHERTFDAMQPFRNNWDSLIQALASDAVSYRLAEAQAS